MKDITISDSATEQIILREGDDVVALVHVLKSSEGDFRKAIILNRREYLKLYQGLQEIILGRVKYGTNNNSRTCTERPRKL